MSYSIEDSAYYKAATRAGEMAWWVRTLAVFLEDPGSIPSTHMAAQKKKKKKKKNNEKKKKKKRAVCNSHNPPPRYTWRQIPMHMKSPKTKAASSPYRQQCPSPGTQQRDAWTKCVYRESACGPGDGSEGKALNS